MVLRQTHLISVKACSGRDAIGMYWPTREARGRRVGHVVITLEDTEPDAARDSRQMPHLLGKRYLFLAIAL